MEGSNSNSHHTQRLWVEWSTRKEALTDRACYHNFLVEKKHSLVRIATVIHRARNFHFSVATASLRKRLMDTKVSTSRGTFQDFLKRMLATIIESCIPKSETSYRLWHNRLSFCDVYKW